MHHANRLINLYRRITHHVMLLYRYICYTNSRSWGSCYNFNVQAVRAGVLSVRAQKCYTMQTLLGGGKLPLN